MALTDLASRKASAKAPNSVITERLLQIQFIIFIPFQVIGRHGNLNIHCPIPGWQSFFAFWCDDYRLIWGEFTAWGKLHGVLTAYTRPSTTAQLSSSVAHNLLADHSFGARQQFAGAVVAKTQHGIRRSKQVGAMMIEKIVRTDPSVESARHEKRLEGLTQLAHCRFGSIEPVRINRAGSDQSSRFGSIE